MPDLIVRGMVSGREVYRGALNAGTRWILVDVATTPPAITPPPNAPPATTATTGPLAGSWHGTLTDAKDGHTLILKLAVVEQGGVAEFEGFLFRCRYAIEPASSAGESRRPLLIFPNSGIGGSCDGTCQR